MSIKIPVDYTKLYDSPYDSSNSNFEFTFSESRGLVEDIMNGNRSCYLISGYRGAGKTSLIKKIEHEIKSIRDDVVFIFLNFAKHEPRSILLRKLIRNFYLQLADKKENAALYRKLKDNADLTEPLKNFKDLYERTFFEVSKNSNERISETNTTVFGFNANLKDLLLSISAVLTFVATLIGFDLTKWYSYIPVGAAVTWTVMQFVSLEKKRQKENTNTDETSKSTLYDDEIAEYYITEILIQLKPHIKPIFILDELDKINDDHLVENIINELKPLMLSGLASFIVIAGQNLYYNYYIADASDDDPLSTMFSKVHHVPLQTASELRVLFTKVLKVNKSELPTEDNRLLEAFCDYLIFESRRVPRRFISLVRQNLSWENNQAFLQIDASIHTLVNYSKILNRIETIDNQTIATEGYPRQIRDYLNTGLFLKAKEILRNPKAGIVVDKFF
jgi:Cdc6-like AAA superfamily ATPase